MLDSPCDGFRVLDLHPQNGKKQFKVSHIPWVVPLPSNRNHQDYYIFSRGFLKTFICHCYWEGGQPNISQTLNVPVPLIGPEYDNAPPTCEAHYGGLNFKIIFFSFSNFQGRVSGSYCFHFSEIIIPKTTHETLKVLYSIILVPNYTKQPIF